MTAARARGLSDGRITTAYVGRNAVLPLLSQFAITAGLIVGGAVLHRGDLCLPGHRPAGSSSRIKQRDYPVMQGVVLLITISVIVANLIADLLYAKLDPRIGRAGGASGMSVVALVADATSGRALAGPLAARRSTSCGCCPRKPLGLARLIGVVFFVVLAFIVPLFVPLQDSVDVTAIYAPPSRAHPLGTDFQGGTC